MNLPRPCSLPLWTVAGPLAACALLGAVWGRPLGGLVAVAIAVALVACVMVAVQHAETVAHRVGEPFGALILALAVTVIEVSLIVSLKLFGGAGQDTLARDTVFATVMIVCNGIVGLCLLAGALRNHVAVFRVEGSSPALAVLIPLTTLALVLPQFTTTTAGPTYSNLQLAFAGLMSLLLFGVYVFVQTIRHREHFLPIHTPGDAHRDRKPALRLWQQPGLSRARTARFWCCSPPSCSSRSFPERRAARQGGRHPRRQRRRQEHHPQADRRPAAPGPAAACASMAAWSTSWTTRGSTKCAGAWA
jgi:Ca2+/H+ antiporter